MALVNMTPHPIHVILPDGTATIPPSGQVARCAVTRMPFGQVRGTDDQTYGGDFYVPRNITALGAVEGLPERKTETYYIVSRLVFDALPGRHDLLVPDDVVRDEAGAIVGCKSFCGRTW